MSPARNRFKVWKINLVEQPGWEPFDPVGELNEDVFNLAADFLGHIEGPDYIPMLEDLAGSIYDSRPPRGPHEWSPRKKLGLNDLALIASGLASGDQRLELVDMTIRDVATDMYEVALTPTDRDVLAALLEAKYELSKSFELGEMSDPWEVGTDNLWAPLLETGLTLEGILSEMVGMGVRYERLAGYYDRFLVFDLNMASAPSELLSAIPKKDRGWVTRSVLKDWELMSQDLIKRFFLILKKDMKNVNIENRTSWRMRWREMLKSTNLKPLQDEMMAFIRDDPTGDSRSPG